MAEQRLSAVVRIGGAVEKTLTKGLLRTSDRLGDIGKSIREVKKRQSELARQRKTLIDQGKSVDQLDKEYRQLSETLVRLKDRQAAWQRVASRQRAVGASYSNMRSEVGRFGRRATIAIGGASAAVFGLASSTASLGDEVAKTSDKLGMSMGRLQELRYAAERSGVSTEKLDSSMERFVKRTGEAVNGTGAAAKAYEELGLSADAMANMQPDEALAIIADRLMDVDNQAQRTAYAAAFFGREGVGMVNMLRDGSEGLDQLAADARRTGYVLSDEAARDAEAFEDQMLDTKLTLAGLKNTIGVELMPVVRELSKNFGEWMRENRDEVRRFATEFGQAFRDAIPRIRAFGRGLIDIGNFIGGVIVKAADLVGGFDRLGMVIVGLFAGKAVLSVAMFAGSVIKLGIALGSLAAMALPAVLAGVKAIGVAMVANPIGLVITAIAGAAFLVYKYWDPIKEWFGDVWEDMKASAGAAFDFFKDLLKWSPLGLMVQGFGVAFDWFIDNWGGIKDWFGGVWDGMKGSVSSAIDAIKTIIGWSPLGLMAKGWAPLTEWFGKLWDGIKAKAGAAIDWIAAKIEWVGDAIETAKGWVGMGGDDDDPESVTDPGRRSGAQSVERAQQYAAGRTSYQQVKQDWNIQITQQPGQDAQEVVDEIERRQRDQFGGALYDGPTTFSGAAGY